eukprot:UN24215
MRKYNFDTKQYDLANLSKIFSPLKEHGKVFGDYVVAHEKSRLHRMSISKGVKGKKFIHYCQAVRGRNNGNHGLDVGSLLISPASRIPRYQLLIGEITKNCSDPTVTYCLKECREMMKKICEEINIHFRCHENKRALLEIMNCLGGVRSVGFDLTSNPHRSLRSKNNLIYVIDPVNKWCKLCLCITFSDLLLFVENCFPHDLESGKIKLKKKHIHNP